MSAPVRDKPRSLLQTIGQWVRARSDQAGRDLMALSDREAEHISEDLGISTAELYRLARSDAKDADLVLARMAALDLDCTEVARREPGTMHDLQRLCTLCSRRKRCASDLARTPIDPRWKDYCPNVATLLALDAMPWESRREW